MVIQGQIVNIITASGNESVIKEAAEVHVGPSKRIYKSGAITSLDSLFVPYTFYSSELPRYTTTEWNRRLNPFTYVPNLATSPPMPGLANLMTSMENSGHFYYTYSATNTMGYPTTLVQSTGNIDYVLDKQYYLDDIEYSGISSIAIRSPWIIGGWGRDQLAKSRNSFRDLLTRDMVTPEFPALTGIRNYHVGPLNLGWDNLKGIWRPMKWYTIDTKNPYLASRAKISPGWYDVRRMGDASGLGCSLFDYTYPTYFMPLAIRGRPYNLYFEYQSGCYWKADDIDLSQENNKKNIVSPTLRITAREENSVKYYNTVVNFSSVFNNTSGQNWNVNYINHGAFNPTVVAPVYLMNAPRLWLGDCASTLTPMNKTVDGFPRNFRIDCIIAGKSTGVVPTGTNGIWGGMNYVEFPNLGDPISGVFKTSIKDTSLTNFTIPTVSGNSLQNASGILDTNNKTFTVIFKMIGVGHTGFHTWSMDYSTGTLPWYNEYRSSGFYMGFVISK